MNSTATEHPPQVQHSNRLYVCHSRVNVLAVHFRSRIRATGKFNCTTVRKGLKIIRMAEGKDPTSAKIKLQWSKTTEKAPRRIATDRGAAIVAGTTVYFYHMTDEICAYDTISSTWTASIPSPQKQGYSLAFVNNKLTAIGGGYFLHYTNKLYTLSGEGIDLSWNEDFKPMPTKRANTIATTTGTALIVAGGSKTGLPTTLGDATVFSVEVMNTNTLQWSSAAPFPTSLYDGSMVACNGNIYVASMRQTTSNHEDGLVPTRHVYTCSIDNLLQSCTIPLFARLAGALSISPSKDVWRRVSDLPVSQTTCVAVQDQLLAIGGSDTEGDATTAVQVYNPASDSWEVIGHISVPRMKCFSAFLPAENKVMVVGGYTNENARIVLREKHGDTTDSVEFATIVE